MVHVHMDIIMSGRGAQISNREEPLGRLVEDHLLDVLYPSSKSEIIAHAAERGVPQRVLFVLQHIPDRAYQSAVEVAQRVQGIG